MCITSYWLVWYLEAEKRQNTFPLQSREVNCKHIIPLFIFALPLIVSALSAAMSPACPGQSTKGQPLKQIILKL